MPDQYAKRLRREVGVYVRQQLRPQKLSKTIVTFIGIEIPLAVGVHEGYHYHRGTYFVACVSSKSVEHACKGIEVIRSIQHYCHGKSLTLSLGMKIRWHTYPYLPLF